MALDHRDTPGDDETGKTEPLYHHSNDPLHHRGKALTLHEIIQAHVEAEQQGDPEHHAANRPGAHQDALRTVDPDQAAHGAMLEVLHSHSSVVYQPEFDQPGYRGANPYALGFGMMQDIKRICTEPKPEDEEWFPEIAGRGNWQEVLRDAWANYRDESFIRQFLSPHLIRQQRLFTLADDANERHYTVTAIHDQAGYKRVRETLAESYNIGSIEPDIQVQLADSELDAAWGVKHIGAGAVHTLGNQGAGVKV